jgi:hypothetical protein
MGCRICVSQEQKNLPRAQADRKPRIPEKCGESNQTQQEWGRGNPFSPMAAAVEIVRRADTVIDCRAIGQNFLEKPGGE